MRDFLVLYIAFFIVSLTTQPLFGLHIIVAVGLALFSQQIKERKNVYAWYTMGLCTVSLLIFCGFQWFTW